MLKTLSAHTPLLRLAICCLLTVTSRLSAGESPLDFNRDVRPILGDHCLHCHGPDAAQRQGDLRLDERTAAFTVLKAGDPAGSELYRRITSADPQVHMPPPDSGRTLSAAQQDTIRRWIAEGAVWGDHWSWKPLQRPQVPVPGTAFPHAPVRNPIDAFLQARLHQSGLAPSPEASRATLIRRLSLELTGLPPTPAETLAFEQDNRPDALEGLVDRLLSSPHYGERMAWDWLDAARYADSNGYQGDTERTMWPWRDWVVESFNGNLPWDQFTIRQLAGDLLPDAGDSERLATAFCRNHMINGEGGRIAEENRVDYVMDMAETTGTLWLGLTFNCCRCHDHKFDALSQQDYYSLFAFFNQTPVTGDGRSGQTPPVLAMPTSAQRAEQQRLQAEISRITGLRTQRESVLNAEQPDQESSRLQQLTAGIRWQRLAAEQLEADHQTLRQLEDLSIFASGPNPANDAYRLTLRTAPGHITALRLDALRHPSHTQQGLARSDSGNFVLTDLRVLHVRGSQQLPVPIVSAEATFEQGDLKVSNAFDSDRLSGWAVYEGRPIDRDHAAVFRFTKPIELQTGDRLKIELRHDSVHVSHQLGLFALSVTSEMQPSLSHTIPEQLLQALRTPREKRTPDQQAAIRNDRLSNDTEHVELSRQLREFEETLKRQQSTVPLVMVMSDQSARRETFLLNRGLYTSPGRAVSAAVPASLPPLPPAATGTRLDLAHWLVSSQNPLTARVVVNRFWQQIFGTGLVKTANDFGVQGELPVHPELLDWLAVDFRDSGWDVKRLVKLMVTSHAYRQSSTVRAEQLEQDPENRLLARSPRYRWPAWMLRDQALAASGLITRTLGGPPVNVYQPPGIWEEATFGRKTYSRDSGAALYRRSLYVFWRRIIGPTMFFDNAARQTCSVSVFRTNSPLHALATFNDITWAEAARVMAQQVLTEPAADDRERLRQVSLRILARDLNDNEAGILLAGLARARQQFSADAPAAEALAASGESPRVADLPVAEHAAWTALSLAMLNLDEALSKQ
ncbi:MAG: PSD1 and planctomycete cytochrome C domain-containing protein [Planctomycetota bacterium]